MSHARGFHRCVVTMFLSFVGLMPAMAAERPATGVVVATVREQALSDDIEVLGTVLANESVVMSSKITEVVVSIPFRDGEHVKRGALLVQLDDQEEQANLRSEQAVLAERESAFRRTDELFKRKVGSEADVDAALARVNQSKAIIEGIRSRIAVHRITAPFDGVLGLRTVSEGILVEPGDALTTLDDLSTVKVDVAVPVVYLSQLAAGMEVTAETSAYAGQTFTGTLASVSSRVDPATRTVIARVIFANPNRRLLPGMLMKIRIQTQPREALMVPESAVFAIGAKQYVFVVEDGTPALVQRRELMLGSRRFGAVEIRSGVAVGERVVSHGAMKLSDGAPVTLMAVDDGALSLPEVLRPAPVTGATP